MNSVLNGINGYENQTPHELIEKSGSREIFKLIKRGYKFDDEVLKKAHISKEIRDERVYNEFVPKKDDKPKKTYKKETASYEEILESLAYTEIDDEEIKNEDEDDMTEFFGDDDE